MIPDTRYNFWLGYREGEVAHAVLIIPGSEADAEMLGVVVVGVMRNPIFFLRLLREP